MTDITNDVLRQELEQSFSQCLTAGTPTKMAAEIWVACVSTSRLDVWTKLLWQRQRRAGSAGGVKRLKERRYPDFEDRTHTLASLLTAVAPLLAMPGYVTDAEYQEHLQDEMRRLLPFLDARLAKPLRAD